VKKPAVSTYVLYHGISYSLYEFIQVPPVFGCAVLEHYLAGPSLSNDVTEHLFIRTKIEFAYDYCEELEIPNFFVEALVNVEFK